MSRYHLTAHAKARLAERSMPHPSTLKLKRATKKTLQMLGVGKKYRRKFKGNLYTARLEGRLLVYVIRPLDNGRRKLVTAYAHPGEDNRLQSNTNPDR